MGNACRLELATLGPRKPTRSSSATEFNVQSFSHRRGKSVVGGRVTEPHPAGLENHLFGFRVAM